MFVSLDPQLRLILPEAREIHLVLVGIGGTGSHLAGSLGSILVHARSKGVGVSLTLFDPEIVEEKNIGRQQFCYAELGQNKAMSMAWRLNAAFGLEIVAVPETFTPESMSLVKRGYGSTTLLIGAVDGHLGRQAMTTVCKRNSGRIWWLDTGNDFAHGQVLVGNSTHAHIDPLGLVTALPAPDVQEPLLLEEDKHYAQLSCAERLAREEQSLLVNRMSATIAASYVQEFVFKRTLSSFATHFQLHPPSTRSTLLTQSNLTPWLQAQEENTYVSTN